METAENKSVYEYEVPEIKVSVSDFLIKYNSDNLAKYLNGQQSVVITVGLNNSTIRKLSFCDNKQLDTYDDVSDALQSRLMCFCSLCSKPIKAADHFQCSNVTRCAGKGSNASCFRIFLNGELECGDFVPFKNGEYEFKKKSEDCKIANYASSIPFRVYLYRFYKISCFHHSIFANNKNYKKDEVASALDYIQSVETKMKKAIAELYKTNDDEDTKEKNKEKKKLKINKNTKEETAAKLSDFTNNIIEMVRSLNENVNIIYNELYRKFTETNSAVLDIRIRAAVKRTTRNVAIQQLTGGEGEVDNASYYLTLQALNKQNEDKKQKSKK
jgi:hypothetical protein